MDFQNILIFFSFGFFYHASRADHCLEVREVQRFVNGDKQIEVTMIEVNAAVIPN